MMGSITKLPKKTLLHSSPNISKLGLKSSSIKRARKKLSRIDKFNKSKMIGKRKAF